MGRTNLQTKSTLSSCCANRNPMNTFIWLWHIGFCSHPTNESWNHRKCTQQLTWLFSFIVISKAYKIIVHSFQIHRETPLHWKQLWKRKNYLGDAKKEYFGKIKKYKWSAFHSVCWIKETQVRLGLRKMLPSVWNTPSPGSGCLIATFLMYIVLKS